MTMHVSCPLRGHIFLICEIRIEQALCRRLQEIDCKINALWHLCPGALMSRGLEAPQAEYHSDHIPSSSSSGLTSSPILAFVTNVNTLLPSSRRLLAVDDLLFQLHIRNTVHAAVRRSGHSAQIPLPDVHAYSAGLQSASPDGPLPITATFLPVRTFGGHAFTHNPFAYAFSMMARSFSLVATGSPFRLHVHAASHSAGQTREVNSGKLFVFFSLLYACSPVSVYIPDRSIPERGCAAGIRSSYRTDHHALPDRTVHRMPYILHPAAAAFLSEGGVWNSLKCLILSFGASATETCLSYSIKPVGFPILPPPTYFCWHKMPRSVPVLR